MKITQEQINAFQKLGYTDEEITDIIACDERIDKGEKLFELSEQQEQNAKKMRKVDKMPTVYKFDKRNKKVNAARTKIIQEFANFALKTLGADTTQIINPEREFLFAIEGTTYKIVMSVPRK